MDARSGEVLKQWCHISTSYPVTNMDDERSRSVMSIAICRSGDLLCSGCAGGYIRLWDTSTGSLLKTFDLGRKSVRHILAVRDGRIVAGLSSGEVKVLDLESGQTLLEPFNVHFDQCIETLLGDRLIAGKTCMALLSDGEHFVSGRDDKTLRIWSANNGKQNGEPFIGHQERITCVSVMPDERHIASGSSDRTVRVWSIGERMQVEKWFKFDSGRVTCLAVSGDGRRIASGYDDASIRVWEVTAKGKLCNVLRGHTGSVSEVLFHPDGDTVISRSKDGAVYAWDVSKKSVQRTFDQHEGPVLSVAFTPDGRYAISGSEDRSVRIWDANSGMQVGTPLLANASGVTGVAVRITGDGQQVVSTYEDFTVRVWDFESHKPLHTFYDLTDKTTAMELMASGDQVVTSAADQFDEWNFSIGKRNRQGPFGYEVRPRRSNPFATISVTINGAYVTADGLRVVWFKRGKFSIWDLERRHILIGRISETGDWMSFVERVNETSERDSWGLFSLRGREIWYNHVEGEILLAVLDTEAICWALSPDKETVCFGLADGHVIFAKLER